MHDLDEGGGTMSVRVRATQFDNTSACVIQMKAVARCLLGYVRNDLFTHQRCRRGYRWAGTLEDGEKKINRKTSAREKHA